jgi:hypothetical protein
MNRRITFLMSLICASRVVLYLISSYHLRCVLHYYQIEYPWKHIINPIDTCIEALVIRGAMQMAQFFSGEKTTQFQWLEIKEDEDHLNKPGE